MKKLCILIPAWAVITLLVACTAGEAPMVDAQQAIEASVTALLVRTEVAEVLATRTPALLPETTTPSPAPAPPRTSSPGILETPSFDCVPEDTLRQIGLVTHVVDGDTIDVLIDGQTFRVRYIGMDAQEPGHADPEISRLAERAAEENSRLVDEQIVTLVRDVSDTDRYGRLLRYVFLGELGGTFVNFELIRTGYAWAADYPPDIACSQVLRMAEQTARQANLGMWGMLAGPVRTEPVEPPTPPATTTAGNPLEGNCDAAYPEVCIPPPPPDLDCQDIEACRFRVLPPDPHFFDGDEDGMGCERCPED